MAVERPRDHSAAAAVSPVSSLPEQATREPARAASTARIMAGLNMGISSCGDARYDAGRARQRLGALRTTVRWRGHYARLCVFRQERGVDPARLRRAENPAISPTRTSSYRPPRGVALQ